MKVTKAQILRIMPHANRLRIDDDLKTLNEWAPRFGVGTPLRMAHFLAQIAHESGEFRYTEEIASGSAYEGRKDLGNTQPGDGVRYKGRGYIQITGRANYQAYQDSGHCVGNIMAHPELLSLSPGRMKSALWFFATHGCLKYADLDDVRMVTRKVNGGCNGLAQRMYYWRMAKRVFGIN